MAPTWTDRRGRDRTPSIPGHELAGVVTALGYGTTGLSMGQRVFGLTDWHRDGTLAEYVAAEARNLAPLPGDVDFTVGASLPISGLTAWQGLFDHGRLQAGQSVLVHGAAGAVGSMVTQLAREFGAYVIGTGRAADRQKAFDFGAQEFADLGNDALEDVGGVDLIFDVIDGGIQQRSAGLVRAGGTLVSVVGPTEARPADCLAIDFVVESDRAQLGEVVQRVRDGRLRTVANPLHVPLSGPPRPDHHPRLPPVRPARQQAAGRHRLVQRHHRTPPVRPARPDSQRILRSHGSRTRRHLPPNRRAALRPPAASIKQVNTGTAGAAAAAKPDMAGCPARNLRCPGSLFS